MVATEYHERTKHAFHRFARSAGRLDWATQPNPFRRYAGAPLFELPRVPLAVDAPYDALYTGAPPQPVDETSVAELLRCSMGLSAWKSYQSTRWALRVNPSSGNLHPTEAYLVWGSRILHYAPDEHLLEERAVLAEEAWRAFVGDSAGVLVGLTTIGWREAWKYGERAFRYCHHDIGHALAAVRLAAAMLGWQADVLTNWSDDQVSILLGLDQTPDGADVEREVPACLLAVTPGDPAAWLSRDATPLLRSATAARWQGQPNQLSPSRVDWPVLAEVERATRYPGSAASEAWHTRDEMARAPGEAPCGPPSLAAREVILRRRSAVAFDARTALPRAAFFGLLGRLLPGVPPWDVLPTDPLVHLVVFVHRVDGLTPGVYAYLRDPGVESRWRAAMRPEFLWESVAGDVGGGALRLLLPADVTWPAKRVSCDQDIAGDGFFSVGMLAPLRRALAERGEWMYRRLFWECGVIGQVLYLEAEAAGARGTGIGCFYDDAVHELLGLRDTEWQSLYHFSMGAPVEDGRLTTDPGYPWEVVAT